MDAEEFPVRRTDALQQGRESHTGAVYFVTFITADRQSWLATPRTRDVFLAVLRTWHAEKNGRILAVTAMPDHAHVLFELGNLLSVGQTMARWKSGIRRGAGYAETFQRDFWEHRLRETTEIEDYALYIFLNPYRARLIGPDRNWPGWWAPDPGLFEFTRLLTAAGGPPPEWMDWPDEKFAGLAHGE